MAADFKKIAQYAKKLGIYDIELALRLQQEGKLSKAKTEALKDVMSFAKQNGVKDFDAEFYNYNKDKPKNPNPIQERTIRSMLENDLTYGQAFFKDITDRNNAGNEIEAAAVEAGKDPKEALVELRQAEQQEAKDRANAIAEEQRQRKNNQLYNIGAESFGSPGYHRNYWKAMTGDKQAIESNPIFGSDAFKENSLRYSPLALAYNQDTFKSLLNSDLLNKLENLGRKELPERQLYNQLLTQNIYDQTRRNPLNVLTGRYEYLRPKEYGDESSWITNLRSRLGFTPFNQVPKQIQGL